MRSCGGKFWVFGKFWVSLGLKVGFWVDLGEKVGFEGFSEKVGSAASELIPSSEIHRLGVKMGYLH